MFRFVLAAILAALVGATYVPFKTPTDEGIVGGVDTTIEEHPHQLGLIRSGRHICGASLIKPNVALTAAHCTWGNAKFSVSAGSVYENDGQIVDVLHICRHPKFDPHTIDYDISVLILVKSLPLSASIKPIDLQAVGVEVPDGTLATVTGWGALREGGNRPKVLQKVELPKVNHQKCADVYAIRRKITERMECYGLPEGKKDSCQGDSGGPIVANGKQTGVVSWGHGCARPNQPGVYSNISNKDIREHINQCIAKYQA